MKLLLRLPNPLLPLLPNPLLPNLCELLSLLLLNPWQLKQHQLDNFLEGKIYHRTYPDTIRREVIALMIGIFPLLEMSLKFQTFKEDYKIVTICF